MALSVMTFSITTPWLANQAAARRRNRAHVSGSFVGIDLGVGEPGVIVDRGLHVLVADASRCPGATAFEAVAAVDAPAAAIAESAELLDVDVDQLAGPGAFIAADRFTGGSVQPRQPG